MFSPEGSLKLLWLEFVFHRRIAYTAATQIFAVCDIDSPFRPREHCICRGERARARESVRVCIHVLVEGMRECSCGLNDARNKSVRLFNTIQADFLHF